MTVGADMHNWSGDTAEFNTENPALLLELPWKPNPDKKSLAPETSAQIKRAKSRLVTGDRRPVTYQHPIDPRCHVFGREQTATGQCSFTLPLILYP